MVHISATALSSIDVKVPKLEVQTAIATVLCNMDAELAALEAGHDAGAADWPHLSGVSAAPVQSDHFAKNSDKNMLQGTLYLRRQLSK